MDFGDLGIGGGVVGVDGLDGFIGDDGIGGGGVIGDWSGKLGWDYVKCGVVVVLGFGFVDVDYGD